MTPPLQPDPAVEPDPQSAVLSPQSSTPTSRISAVLPPDLLEAVRGRVRLLALLLLVAFGIDPILYLVRWLSLRLSGNPLPGDFLSDGAFQVVYLLSALASLGLWRVARNPRVPASRLHTLGLAYEVAICGVIAFTSTWQYYLTAGVVPNMNWVPAIVILVPLLLPGPPRRTLVASIAAAGMTPLSLLVLAQAGKVTANGDALVSSFFHAGFAVGFAYLGARVVYGLGREVTRARELGSYHLGALLGRGGMGEVYQATHRMLARPAAIKLIRPEMTGAGSGAGARLAVSRFRREAQAAASLRSPHTVELYDFGVTRDRTFYFVMELLDGLDLETLVRQTGPLPAARVVHILRQVCASLDEAHTRGLVHRDIKPANIHLGRLGLQHDFVKVLDFGLVKSVAGTKTEDSNATGAGLTPGTPAYMAPEMALGETIDGRADLYALGCVAWYLLTGHTVFHGGNAMQIVMKHLQDTPVPPSQRSELPVPPALDRLVLACLAKRPADRPASARELAHALAAIDIQPWGEPEAAAWWDLHRPETAVADSTGQR
ncbi:MAG: serine/threonine-protein kinase [Gemmatimonadales bacterium]